MKRSDEAFALVDVLMAVLILAIGLSLVTGMISNSYRNVKAARILTNAAYVAEKVKDDLRSPSSPHRWTGQRKEGGRRLGSVDYQWQVEKVKTEAGIDQVQINVAWKDAVGSHTQAFLTCLPKL